MNYLVVLLAVIILTPMLTLYNYTTIKIIIKSRNFAFLFKKIEVQMSIIYAFRYEFRIFVFGCIPEKN